MKNEIKEILKLIGNSSYQGLISPDENEKYCNYIIKLQKDNEMYAQLKDEYEDIINKGIEAINVYQNEKTLSVGYQDLKIIRGILRGNEFDLRMFEEYLQELKGSDKE